MYNEYLVLEVLALASLDVKMFASVNVFSVDSSGFSRSMEVLVSVKKFGIQGQIPMTLKLLTAQETFEALF